MCKEQEKNATVSLVSMDLLRETRLVLHKVSYHSIANLFPNPLTATFIPRAQNEYVKRNPRLISPLLELPLFTLLPPFQLTDRVATSLSFSLGHNSLCVVLKLIIDLEGRLS